MLRYVHITHNNKYNTYIYIIYNISIITEYNSMYYNIYNTCNYILLEREREQVCECKQARDQRTERESWAGSLLSVEPDAGLDPQYPGIIMT